MTNPSPKGALERLAELAAYLVDDNPLRLYANWPEASSDLRYALVLIERQRKALKPFAAVAALVDPLVKAEPERWPDDRPNREFIPGEWPRWSDFKAARAALEGGSDA